MFLRMLSERSVIIREEYNFSEVFLYCFELLSKLQTEIFHMKGQVTCFKNMYFREELGSF